MKMKGKTVVAGNGLAALAARHKGAARSRVQTHRLAKAARPGPNRKTRNGSAKH
jgi:hypothetical protein